MTCAIKSVNEKRLYSYFVRLFCQIKTIVCWCAYQQYGFRISLLYRTFAEVGVFLCSIVILVNYMTEENAGVSIRIYQIEYSRQASASQILTIGVRSQFRIF